MAEALGSRSGPRPRRAPRVWTVVVAAVALAPVWLSPVLVTTDGPSHLYNAMLLDAVDRGRPPFAEYLGHTEEGLRSNRAARALLVALGRAVGWEPAERLLLTAAMLATFALALALARPAGSPASAMLALAAGAGWLAHNWFAWMGFYDFALSVACYAGLLAVLALRPSAWRLALLQVPLLLLYFAHFFTFLIGLGLVVAALAWEVRAHRSVVPLLAAVPAALLATAELVGGPLGASGLGAPRPLVGLGGLLVGDVFVSYHPLDALGGLGVMAGVWAAAFGLVRRLRSGGWATWGEWRDVVGAFGLALLVGSVLAPQHVGEGGYIPERLRLLGVVSLWPLVGAAVRALPARALAVLAVALGAGLAAHGALVLRGAAQVHRDARTLDELLARAGAGEGAWIRSGITDSDRGLFRIAGYRHLHERIALRRQFVVLDNYQTLHPVFPVYWRRVPDWLALRPVAAVLWLRVVPAAVPWRDGLYLVHETDHRLRGGGDGLDVEASVSGGPFTVTRLRRPS